MSTPKLIICDAGIGIAYARNLGEARTELQWWERHADRSSGRSEAVARAVIASMKKRIEQLTMANT